MATVEEKMMQDAGASVDTAYTLSVGDGFEGQLEDRLDEDWVRVELVAGKSYDIRLQGVGLDGVGNTVLRVYNSAGKEVAFNDDIDVAALALNSMVEFSPASSGVYYISAGNYLQTVLDTSGGYLMTVFDEEDNHPDTPYTVSAGGRFNGTLDSNLDRDWIKVELVEGKTYSVTLNGIGLDMDIDTVLRIYNAAGEQVAFHDDVDYAAGKVNSIVTLSPTATGTYYISAGAYAGNPTQDHSGRYQVAVYDEADRDGLVLIGTEDNDSYLNGLIGGPGDDELDGKAGNDWLEGGAGADMLRGGAGVDAARYHNSDAGVEVRLYDGVARGGHAEGDTFAGTVMIEYTDSEGNTRTMAVPDIERLYGSVYADILVGSHGRNTLWGSYGDDELDGREGNDWIEGGPGADVLKGGEGDDIASYNLSATGVEVRLYDGTARGGDAEGDIFAGVQTIEYLDAAGETREMEVPDIEYLYGSDYDDVFAGAHGRNILAGIYGNDKLDGREGDDWLIGGEGNDELAGREGDDWLFGEAGNDILEGGPGNDLLSGGQDNDRLDGGEGDDTFFFAPDGGDDTVLDFGTGGDKIDLTAFADIQSIEDLVMMQQESNLIIDLSGQGGGTVTLQNFNEVDVVDAYFLFFTDAPSAMT